MEADDQATPIKLTPTTAQDFPIGILEGRVARIDP
jgi:hypothetical protein